MERKESMRIGVVAYEMEGRPTGVGRYLAGLLDGLARTPDDAAPGERWLLFFRGIPFEHPLWSAPPEDSSTPGPLFEPRFDRRPHRHPVLWEQLRLPRLLRREKLDAVFSPGYSLPEGARVPGVVTLHDLSFELLGDEFGPRERWRRRLLARRAARRAARVLVDTERAARDLERIYRVPRRRIAVVPLGLDERFRSEKIRQEPKLEADDLGRLADFGVAPPFVLAAGSVLPRRRLDLVIAAFAEIAPRHPGLRLVIAGQNALPHPADLDRWVSSSGVAERIVRPGWVSEEALLALYRRAAAVVYVSTYEGFGLPPLEALALGTPAITSPGMALEELWPDDPFRLPALEHGALLEILGAVLADPEAARRRARAAPLDSLDWRRSARLLRQELRTVIGGG